MSGEKRLNVHSIIGLPLRMARFMGLRKSKEALAAEKLRPVVATPPEAPSPAAPYRGQSAHDVAARYRPCLAAAPFPALKPGPGKHLPFRLASLSSSTRKGKTTNLVTGVIMGTILLAVLVAVLRTGAIAHVLGIGAFLSIPAYLLWPWIRPLFSGALLDPDVEVDRVLMVAGQPFRIHVEQPGPARVTRLAVRVLLTEHVTHGKGEDEVNESHDVTAVWLCEEAAFEIPKGSPFTRSFEATIPADSMHSFVADHNRVEWAVRVEAEIENWPDVKQTYPIAVLPAE